jgi:hypothetical protein
MIDAKELPKLLEFIGAKDAETFEDVQKSVQENYIHKSDLKDNPEVKKLTQSVIGRASRKALDNIASGFSEAGIDFNKTEYEGKDVEEVTGSSVKKIVSHFQSKIQELETLAGKGNDEKVKELETTVTKYNQKIKEQGDLLKSLNEKYETESAKWQKDLKQKDLQVKLDRTFETIKWRSDADELKKKGFFAELNENFKFDLDETGNLEGFSLKTGERVQNPKVNGKFLTVPELLENFGKEKKIWAENPATPNRTGLFTPQKQENTPDSTTIVGGRQRTMASRRG